VWSIMSVLLSMREPRWRSRYSDWPRGRRSILARVKNFPLSLSPRATLDPTKLPIQWVPKSLSLEVKPDGREGDLPDPTSARS
jgi:hypothetical protein